MLKEVITKKANEVKNDTIDKEVLKYFNEYLTYDLDEEYDCSEIADNFKDTLGKGNIIKIFSEGNKPFKILENETVIEVLNHYIYIDKNDKKSLVFDPRFYNKPLYLIDYINIIKSLNDNTKIKYEEE
ncbi:hypothetical protein [Virgibacillus sp. DJP39]|uniref:hypothetical protein n=1 Tax=Virgibacillus sp. DJP39 TaxID=3409790 RepID=UPI003BB6E120